MNRSRQLARKLPTSRSVKPIGSAPDCLAPFRRDRAQHGDNRVPPREDANRTLMTR